MKNIISELENIRNYKDADTLNHENFPAWTMSDSMRLEQLAMTGSLGNSFYVSKSALIADALELLERADAEELARVIVRGRNEGFIRTFPLLGLVVLSKKSSQLFQRTFPKVVLTGNDLEDFISMTRQMRGFGRSIKRAIHSYLRESVTPYYAMKYRRQIADAIRISRFDGNDPLYAYALGAYSRVKGLDANKIKEVYSAYSEFEARKTFLELLEAGKMVEAANVLVKNRLDVDSLSAYYHKFDKIIWTAVAEITPVMRFLKYLAKFAREGVDVRKFAIKKLTVDSLKAAKVFPFRLYSAYEAIPSNLELSKSDTLWGKLTNFTFDVENKSQTIEDILENVLDDYTLEYDWEEFNDYSWVIAPDMSGSMMSRIAGSKLTFSEVSGMFTGFFSKGLNQVRILPWNTMVLPYGIEKHASVIEQIEYLQNSVCGGTYMEVAVDYMLKNRIKTDYAIFITDSMEYGQGWLASWKQYRRFNPNAKAFLLRLDCYSTQPMSDEDAKKNGIYQIFGWNDNVIEYIRYVIKQNKK